MSIGGENPDVVGCRMVDSSVVPMIEGGEMTWRQLYELNEVFSLGLDAGVLSDPEGCVGLVRDRLIGFFDGEGDYHDARDRLHKLTDFLDGVHGVPEHERRVVKEQAAVIKARITKSFTGTMVWAQLDGADLSHPDNREPIRRISRECGIKVKQRAGILDEEGNVVPGMEALNKAVGT